MSLSIGIVGLPNVGKSTLFNALTKKQVEASNYPFCTIEPNVGVVKVPDERLDKIAEVSKPAKILPTAIEFVDIAGLVSGAHKGEGLGNKFLSHVRECDAICEVVRNFQDNNIVHVHGRIDPEGDKQTIGLELVMADLQSVDKQLEKAVKDAKSGDKEAVKKRGLLEKIKIHLDAGKPVRELKFNPDEEKILKSFNLLTIKPIIYVINGISGGEKVKDGFFLNVKQEDEIARLDETEQKEYIKELGLELSGLDKLIKASYELLGLITFFTTGTDETRAWTVVQGAKAPQAAGAIHTDFEEGFIRAEVVNWQDFINSGGEQAAKEKGLIRTEGKDYVMQDGDICHFLFNK
ncbi:redox-regulated ATPase YchF [Candidatus Falkowbacteria bacterium CG11_big_fil_rev_8_21_14_0_20_39_10]|uniref:Ribosome-binding ATPase YchF n=1 Tax=Candidatus Falkowbacteria bacterium CG11_big_fil_rev_8_21_14_0_20_39_10 TaxID=1974570 RepID=A0A2M6KA49_9BACT|nr:MAG: redox-regulated ATPase YchF [Candidatus Falkowbacteria bacterium CG11_big_fil_rev_8_21_14_0_20_39_10]